MTSKEAESRYKYAILEIVAKTLDPFYWTPAARKEMSEGAIQIFQDKARERAKNVMRSIAGFIIPHDQYQGPELGFQIEENERVYDKAGTAPASEEAPPEVTAPKKTRATRKKK